MKVSKTIVEILNEIEITQMFLDSDNNKLRTMELMGKKQGLELALEIIKNNIKKER